MAEKITLAPRPGGGFLIATDGDIEIGRIGWFINTDGVWVFNRLEVAEAYQGRGWSLRLQEAAKAHRIEQGDAPWIRTPATGPGEVAVASHLRANPDTNQLAEGA